MSIYGETPRSGSRSGSHAGSQTRHSTAGSRRSHQGRPEVPPYYESSLMDAYPLNRPASPASQRRDPPYNHLASSLYSQSQNGSPNPQTWTTPIPRTGSQDSEQGFARGERVPPAVPAVPEVPRSESGFRRAPPSEISYAGTLFPTAERIHRDALRRDAERRLEGQDSQGGTERGPRSEPPRTERGGQEYERSAALRSEYGNPNLPYPGSQAPRSERGGAPRSEAPRSLYQDNEQKKRKEKSTHCGKKPRVGGHSIGEDLYYDQIFSTIKPIMAKAEFDPKQKQAMHLHQTITNFPDGGQLRNPQWRPTSSIYSRPQDGSTYKSSAGPALQRSHSTPHSTSRHPSSSKPKCRASQTSAAPAYYESSLLNAYLSDPPGGDSILSAPRRSSRRPQGPKYQPAAPSTHINHTASSPSAQHHTPLTPTLRRTHSDAPKRHRHKPPPQHKNYPTIRNENPYASAVRPGKSQHSHAGGLHRSHSTPHSQSRHHHEVPSRHKEERERTPLDFENPRVSPKTPKKKGGRAESGQRHGEHSVYGIPYEKTLSPSADLDTTVRAPTALPRAGFLERFFNWGSSSSSAAAAAGSQEKKGNREFKKRDKKKKRRRKRSTREKRSGMAKRLIKWILE
ncbi:hypothetical protein B7494_g7034 [Chlorociboria aeruginascens]|nr:hypothetical protein B7494_g7034 [Chlorociboria aeruginascens]